ncbi:MAG TPA: DsbA family oxidoreductase [Chitinophagales bacterium]|nr:DsbA family oxidoreductase [Chitinophagales bacterium]
MKVEIWSDVMCPFCYIGKRKLEAALTQFSNSDNIELEWKSFQLTPGLITQTGKSLNQFLAEHKGMSLEQAAGLNQQVTNMAKQEGLTFNLDKAVIANTINAHRFVHFAKKNGKQNEAEELLFRSYFTDGKNIDDYATLLQLGSEIGLNAEELKAALESNLYANDVQRDIKEAQQIGVRGVPFFVFDRKYAISGAQPVEAFLQTLEQSFSEWQQEHKMAAIEVTEGDVCKPDGMCD